MKVLIADDELVYLKIVEKIIRQWGYEVVQVTDGIDAWKILESDPTVHIALLDWMMPGMDGLEICRRVRARDGMPYVAIIVLSARDQQSDIDAGYQAGVDDYLVKPINSAQLKQRLAVAERVVKMERELRSSSEVLTRLVSSLGKGSEPIVPQNLVPVAVNQCLSMAIASSKYAIRPHVTLVQELMENLPKIQSNPDRLEEIFTHLILDTSQAIRQKGKGALSISSRLEHGKLIVLMEDDASRNVETDSGIPLRDIQNFITSSGGSIQIGPSPWGGIRYLMEFKPILS